MEWINAKENPPVLQKMLVFCENCKNIHTVHYTYNEYCLAEYCYSDGHLYSGRNIEFEWYMPLPKPPEEKDGVD